MQRYCDGCRRCHDLSAFDLDKDEANSVCRARLRSHERAAKAEARRKRQAKIEALEQQRRSLIAALVKIDQEIALVKMDQAPPTSTLEAAPLLEHLDAEDVFGIEGDRDSGD